MHKKNIESINLYTNFLTIILRVKLINKIMIRH